MSLASIVVSQFPPLPLAYVTHISQNDSSLEKCPSVGGKLYIYADPVKKGQGEQGLAIDPREAGSVAAAVGESNVV